MDIKRVKKVYSILQQAENLGNSVVKVDFKKGCIQESNSLNRYMRAALAAPFLAVALLILAPSLAGMNPASLAGRDLKKLEREIQIAQQEVIQNIAEKEPELSLLPSGAWLKEKYADAASPKNYLLASADNNISVGLVAADENTPIAGVEWRF